MLCGAGKRKKESSREPLREGIRKGKWLMCLIINLLMGWKHKYLDSQTMQSKETQTQCKPFTRKGGICLGRTIWGLSYFPFIHKFIPGIAILLSRCPSGPSLGMASWCAKAWLYPKCLPQHKAFSSEFFKVLCWLDRGYHYGEITSEEAHWKQCVRHPHSETSVINQSTNYWVETVIQI